MVATNILSLYHLSTTLQSPKPPSPIPDELIRQLHTIRATINHLTRLQNTDPNTPTKSTIPSDLLLYSHLSPIASSCHNHLDLLHNCPSDSDLAESLILRGCHPLPHRRCFSLTPKKQTSSNSLPHNPFPSSLPDSSVVFGSLLMQIV
ncbi:putative methyltransferase [Trifolium repens]|nr:putative methyltransferase [Trifolium repens]